MIKRFLFVVCCLLLVSACAARSPYSSVRPASRPSQKPYTVLGERYEPLETHEGYVQTGVASWYGPDFHGMKTSNGEIYDMHGLTAAHKTLPLNVYVKVENLENGRKAIVRINDRGPFAKGRIIDLSYAAAKKLGVDGPGTAKVRVEALGYRDKGSTDYKALDSYDAGNYTIQVGAFKDRDNAQRLSSDMRRQEGFSEVRKASVDGETFYRVYAGKYSSLRAAERAEKDFSGRGFPGSFTVALD